MRTPRSLAILACLAPGHGDVPPAPARRADDQASKPQVIDWVCRRRRPFRSIPGLVRIPFLLWRLSGPHPPRPCSPPTNQAMGRLSANMGWRTLYPLRVHALRVEYPDRAAREEGGARSFRAAEGAGHAVAEGLPPKASLEGRVPVCGRGDGRVGCGHDGQGKGGEGQGYAREGIESSRGHERGRIPSRYIATLQPDTDQIQTRTLPPRSPYIYVYIYILLPIFLIFSHPPHPSYTTWKGKRETRANSPNSYNQRDR